MPVPGGVQISAVGSLGMVLLGFNSMQLASRALHSERRNALWLPVLAAVLIAGASMLAAGEAARQETALVEQLTSRRSVMRSLPSVNMGRSIDHSSSIRIRASDSSLSTTTSKA